MTGNIKVRKPIRYVDNHKIQYPIVYPRGIDLLSPGQVRVSLFPAQHVLSGLERFCVKYCGKYDCHARCEKSDGGGKNG